MISTSARISSEIARQSQLAREIARGQADVSTTKRLQVASDDPTASARVAEVRRRQANETVYAANVEDGAATAARADATLTSTATAIDRARELLLSARNSTLNGDGRTAIAAELFGIADDVTSYAATTDAHGRALFPTGAPLALPIGEGVTVAATVSKDAAFGDLATLLRTAASAAANNDGTGVQTALDALAARGSTLGELRAEHGVRAARLDAARDTLAASGVDLAEERGTLEGTDMPATIAALQAKLTTLDAAQSLFAKLNARSLFDML